MNLTPRQLHIAQLIRDTRVAHGYSPTIQEIADELSSGRGQRWKDTENEDDLYDDSLYDDSLYDDSLYDDEEDDDPEDDA